MLHIIFIMLPLFCVIFLGCLAERFAILPKETSSCINQFVYWFSLPLLRFSILAQMRIEQISWGITVGFVGGMMLTQALVALCMYVARYNVRDSAVGGMVGALSNAAFMGIPTIMLLFPDNEQALVVAAFLSILPAVSLISTDTFLSVTAANAKGAHWKDSVKSIFVALLGNPNLVASVLGACIGLGGFILPDTLLVTAQMLGKTAAPCALFCIGITLVRQIHEWRLRRREKECGSLKNSLLQGGLILTKLFICPLLMFCIGSLYGAEGQSLAIMCIIGAMPTAVVGSIVASRHGVLVQQCITCTLFSTCLSALSIPLIVLILA